MILTLARRFAFSPVSGHRSSSIRIIFSLMFSMAVLMTAIGVMDYLQRGRFEGIRGAISFDITVEGDETAKMRTRYPHADIFLYGETEVLAEEGDEGTTGNYLKARIILPEGRALVKGLIYRGRVTGVDPVTVEVSSLA